MEGCWVIRTYKSGRMVEKSKVWVSSRAKIRSGRVQGNTSAAKRDRNAMQAVRVLARSMNCNCSHKWLHMVCKLDDAHLASAEADTEKTLKNFRARLKRAVAKLGGQVAYYEFISHKDGKSGAEKRLHIVEGLIRVISILDEVIATIRASENKADAKENLKVSYDFTEAQAEAIVTLN